MNPQGAPLVETASPCQRLQLAKSSVTDTWSSQGLFSEVENVPELAEPVTAYPDGLAPEEADLCIGGH